MVTHREAHAGLASLLARLRQVPPNHPAREDAQDGGGASGRVHVLALVQRVGHALRPPAGVVAEVVLELPVRHAHEGVERRAGGCDEAEVVGQAVEALGHALLVIDVDVLLVGPEVVRVQGLLAALEVDEGDLVVGHWGVGCVRVGHSG